jgi:hypothetical protein
MGKKIFISYKYGDSSVLSLPDVPFYERTTARHYVDEIQKMIDVGDHINKGENDDEDLSHFKDSTIASKLRDKIYDSSVTIVLISKGMKESYKSDSDQWIPWEVSYSLRESTRDGRTSLTNAILAVVLPDENGSYNYFMEYNSQCDSTNYKTHTLFDILGKNMFNKKNSDTKECNGSTIHLGYFSYIYSVKWESFKGKLNTFVNIAVKINENRDEYEITKTIE